MTERWGLLWRSGQEYLIFKDRMPLLFATRREARAYADKHYGYIRERPDLRTEPHCWRMPVAVRVTIEVRRMSDDKAADGWKKWLGSPDGIMCLHYPLDNVAPNNDLHNRLSMAFTAGRAAAERHWREKQRQDCVTVILVTPAGTIQQELYDLILNARCITESEVR